MAARLLVTGGAGYIGSHTLVALLEAGHTPVALDNFSNSHPAALESVQRITGRPVEYVEGDIRDRTALRKLLQREQDRGTPISGVIHFAALKAVGESVSEPLKYYENNVAGTLTLLEEMERAGVREIVFSSSATVYGHPDRLPLTEDHPIRPINPYGQTKAMVETMLRDLCASRSDFKAICLRYFNPIGAHPSGLIGEDPHGIPNNLMPYITQVAAGKLPCLNVFGNDYPTTDGTGIRDYIHVTDLAEGHVKAIDYAAGLSHGEYRAINLGTGHGTSVLQMIEAVEQACGRKIPYQIEPRRAGDMAAAWADPTQAHTLLGWRTTRTLEDMCADSWKWQSLHPDGYKSMASR